MTRSPHGLCARLGKDLVSHLALAPQGAILFTKIGYMLCLFLSNRCSHWKPRRMPFKTGGVHVAAPSPPQHPPPSPSLGPPGRPVLGSGPRFPSARKHASTPRVCTAGPTASREPRRPLQARLPLQNLAVPPHKIIAAVPQATRSVQVTWPGQLSHGVRALNPGAGKEPPGPTQSQTQTLQTPGRDGCMEPLQGARSGGALPSE